MTNTRSSQPALPSSGLSGSSGLRAAAETNLPTDHGVLRMVVFVDGQGKEHVAMVAGDVRGEDVLCRIHSECLTSEVFGSRKCDCKQQLDRALDLIAKKGRGVVLYLRQEGRGIGLVNKVKAYALQEQGYDTVDANRALGLPDDARDYGVAAAMLEALGVQSVSLLTNNPLKVDGLAAAGTRVARRVPHLVVAADQAMNYLAVKGRRMGHLLDGPLGVAVPAAPSEGVPLPAGITLRKPSLSGEMIPLQPLTASR